MSRPRRNMFRVCSCCSGAGRGSLRVGKGGRFAGGRAVRGEGLFRGEGCRSVGEGAVDAHGDCCDCNSSKLDQGCRRACKKGEKEETAKKTRKKSIRTMFM